MLDNAKRRMTPEEFYAWQEPMDEKYELVDGYPVKMTPLSTRRHDRIVVNLICAVGNRLRGTECQGFTSAITVATGPRTRGRADLGVDCGPFRDDDYAASSPRLVVEVLSPTSQEFGLFDKFAEYKSLPDLDYILFIEPNAPRTCLWSRAEERSWSGTLACGIDAALDIQGLGLTLPLEEGI